ncbi:MAG: 30S ribosomal protein S19 [Candidatus Dojkabacteria bacterium]|nr:30S ribosomal protein S19 [Candidatus Dojkabacteria bacterium]MDQ7021385.1 30S ribosomal protein S19 [Candidatus Dojkabacteria bacterium]
MSRSSKKGPYIDPRVLKKVKKQKDEGSNKAIKTWSRACTISPDMVGVTFEVHNGRYFIKVFVTESMVGHKLGEFSPTRKFNGHSKKGKIAKATGSTGRAA